VFHCVGDHHRCRHHLSRAISTAPHDKADLPPSPHHVKDTLSPSLANAALLFATLVIAVCGLVYELLAGTISSYLLGDSVYQFSIVIGVFMAAMGFGAYLSRHIQSDLTDAFIVVQLLLGAVGGISAPALYFAYAIIDNYQAILLLSLTLTGTLVGLEIPLVIRILRAHKTLRVNLSNVLSLDYAGALIAAILFPLVLVPQLGLIRTSLLFGLLNVCVALLATYVLASLVRRLTALTMLSAVLAVALVTALIGAEPIERFVETKLYNGNIILAKTTRYQRLVVSRIGEVTNFYINGGLQFSSIDEYRYHESLVHPVMGVVERHDRVLIIGGGDGLAAREVLRYPGVKEVVLVDLDPEVTRLFSNNADLRLLNASSLSSSKLTVVNADAGQFLEQETSLFDVVIIDLPDPHDISISRLYTRHFYSLVTARLSAGGALVTQATSPYYARAAFWSIAATLGSTRAVRHRDRELFTIPYHAYVPTFGDWGFVIAAPRRIQWSKIKLPKGLRFLSSDSIDALRVFSPDTDRIEVDVNTLQTHRLANYYEQGWSRWYR